MLNVGLDAVGTQNHAGGATNVAFTGLTIGASGVNRALGVAISFLNDPGAVSVARWDDGGTNQNLTTLLDVSFPALSWFTKLYGLVAPTTGNKTLQITWTNAVEYAVNAISFVNVDQSGGATSFPNATSLSIPKGPTIGTLSQNIGSGGAAFFIGASGDGFGATAGGPIQWLLQAGLGTVEWAGAYSFYPGVPFSMTMAGVSSFLMAGVSVAPIYDTGGVPVPTTRDTVPVPLILRYQ